MRAFFVVLSGLACGASLLAGCSYQQVSTPPDYSQQPLHSLCDHGKPVTVHNRGRYDSPAQTGELLLAGQLSTRPVEDFLTYRTVRLQYLAATGLQVTLTDPWGETQNELLPGAWIRCVDGAMELDLPSDSFYVWASVGVKNRRLRLQVTTENGLVMHHLWEEKGMMAVVFPVRFSGDAWASFQAVDPAEQEPAPPRQVIARIGECPELNGTYTVDGTSVRLDGSVDRRATEAQFFRPEVTGGMAPPAEDWSAVRLDVSQSANASIVMSLVGDDGTRIDRQLDASQLSCDRGRWFVKGAKDVSAPWLLLTGSGGITWEDLSLWRDDVGALMVRGTYRSRAAIFLIPTGVTEEIFVRYERLTGNLTTP